MHLIAAFISLLGMVTPTRTWYPATAPLTVKVTSNGESQLVLLDFNGQQIAPTGSTAFKGTQTFDLMTLYPGLGAPGAYVLLEQPKGKPLAEFEGTPWVVEVRADPEREKAQEPQVRRVIPLEYAVMTTNQGPMTLVFYYDVAPVTVASFLDLCRTGFYDGLKFHRIVPGFVIQGGDPTGTGSGSAGYHVPDEFSDRKHEAGVLSMAHSTPRNSGGSQFFVCLDYARTKILDGKYTAFGKVTDGLDVAEKISSVGVSGKNPKDGPPATPQTIEKVEIKPVTAKDDPYVEMLHLKD